MLAALILSLAMTAAPAAAQPKESCAGVHCAPLGDTAPRSDSHFGSENLDSGRVQGGYDRQAQRFGSGGADRSFDNRHDASFDRSGFDNSGTWPPH